MASGHVPLQRTHQEGGALLAHIREVARKKSRNGIAHEVRGVDGGKERRKTFTDKGDAEGHALTVENTKSRARSRLSLLGALRSSPRSSPPLSTRARTA